MSLVEFRSYLLQAGSLPTFRKLMTEVSLPLLAADGQEVLLAQATADGSDQFLLVRAYQSLYDRERQQQAFYSSEAWQKGPRSQILACVVSSHDCLVEFDAIGLSSLKLALMNASSDHLSTLLNKD